MEGKKSAAPLNFFQAYQQYFLAFSIHSTSCNRQASSMIYRQCNERYSLEFVCREWSAHKGSKKWHYFSSPNYRHRDDFIFTVWWIERDKKNFPRDSLTPTVATVCMCFYILVSGRGATSAPHKFTRMKFYLWQVNWTGSKLISGFLFHRANNHRKKG